MQNKTYTPMDSGAGYLFHQGSLEEAYRCLGAHIVKRGGEEGTLFAVWAPHAAKVSVVGEFNGWRADASPLTRTGQNIWEGFVPNARKWQRYKYEITPVSGETFLKSDPYARFSEYRPDTASIIYEDDYSWQDEEYMRALGASDPLSGAMNIYEVHPGSWRRNEEGGYYTYQRLADELPVYARDMGYTHIELMPLMEHPFDGSWGYQVTGFYSATSRYGTPEDLKGLVDRCHALGIGVIADWVPGHFCRDAHGLDGFDGTALYGGSVHPNWGTVRFDFSVPEVRSFLISCAVYWLEEFHLDGLRVDGVTSMLYSDFGMEGGSGQKDENAISFLQEVNARIASRLPGRLMIAEESSEWPGVTAPVSQGGLGFSLKWNMGWMNDTLAYYKLDGFGRHARHDLVTFPMMYAYSERFVLPYSHDEVVHGKRSIIGRMPGDYREQMLGVRLALCLQMFYPGKKLTFMGAEIAQYIEWRYYEQLEWFLLANAPHREHKAFTAQLNRFYLEHPALWEDDFSWNGFTWLNADDREGSVLSFVRRSREEELIIALNMDFAPHAAYPMRVEAPAAYSCILSSDGSRPPLAIARQTQGGEYEIRPDLPSLTALVFKKLTAPKAVQEEKC